MTDNPQQISAGFGESESASLAELEEQLRKIRAEKAILELQLREYSEQLDQKVEERTRELEAINRIAATVGRSLNLDVILRESLSKVLELLELDVGGIFLVEEKKARMSLMIHQGLPRDVVEVMSSIPIGLGCPGLVVQRGEPVLEENLSEADPEENPLAKHPEFSSHIGIPLESKGRVRGVMCLLSPDKDGFSQEEIKILAAIGSEIGVAIENAELYERSYSHSKKMEELSITDSLTGLFNRRFFYRRLKEEMARAKRQKHPVSLLVVDLDNLKQYNDEKGHLKGDEALRGVAQAITACIRQDVDSGYRYGGDEFAVILPYSDEVKASGVAERIRNTYEGFAFPNTSLSIGLTELNFSEGVDELVSRADSAMYVAKHSGGNKVYIETAREGSEEEDGEG
ncbi:phytochrome-like protein cph2 [bacterium BMS3Abin01]|nr:phytochrome-like protein cph2 [bacterium BMS3Abin01]